MIMCFTIYKFTFVLSGVIRACGCADAHEYRIQHPFLLSDNRHYTFYIWRRVFLLHPLVPYLLVPGYVAFVWAWYIRIGARFVTSDSMVSDR